MKANITRAQTESLTDNAIEILTGFFVMTLHKDFGWGEKRLKQFMQKLGETAEYYKKQYQDKPENGYHGAKYQLDDTLRLAVRRDLNALGINLIHN